MTATAIGISQAHRRGRIIFVTGTDTGVGKTVLTALLLRHLRRRGVHALAMKPFCAGGRGDVRLLQALQPGELPDEEANPFYFRKALAPLVAGCAEKKSVRLSRAVAAIKRVKKKCDWLLVEGVGGLLVPLGEGYTVADLLVRLGCEVIVVARNSLGTINHTTLTVRALEEMKIKPGRISVVLMGQRVPDLSSRTNFGVLREMLVPVRIFPLPYLGKITGRNKIKKAELIMEKALEEFFSPKTRP